MLSIRRRCPDNTHHKISLTPLVVTKRWFAGHISIIRCHFSKHKTGPRQYNLSIIGFNGNGINTNWCWIQTKTSEKYEIDMFSLDGLKTTAVCCSEILKVLHVNCQRDCDERKRDRGRLAVIQLPLSFWENICPSNWFKILIKLSGTVYLEIMMKKNEEEDWRGRGLSDTTAQSSQQSISG